MSWHDRRNKTQSEYVRETKCKPRSADNKQRRNEWLRILMECDYRCVLCGHEGSVDVLVRDHMLPLRHGGTDDADNWQPLCRECNVRKGARSMHDITEWRYWEWGGTSALTYQEFQDRKRTV